jgi:arsenate reductase
MSKEYSTDFFPELARFIAARESEFAQIPESRQDELSQLAEYVRGSLQACGVAKLTFICTHNSRRSHLSQIWAKVAADACGLTGVQTFSGGTEATAMNPRVVDSLRRSGLLVDADDPTADNPLYRVSYSHTADPLVCFSKVYDQSPNPASNYCAIMTCSSADDACPIVPGCELRLPIRYEDPKVADDSPAESSVYDDRSRQICREMLFAMLRV